MLRFKYAPYAVIVVLFSIALAQYKSGKAVRSELRAEQVNTIKLSESIRNMNDVIVQNELSIKELMLANESLNKHFTTQRHEFKRVKQNDKNTADWSSAPIPESIKRLYERTERVGANGYR